MDDDGIARTGVVQILLAFAREMAKDLLERVPAVGGVVAAIEQFDDERVEAEVADRLERLLEGSSSTSAVLTTLQEDVGYLTDLATISVVLQTELVEWAKRGDRTLPDRPDQLAARVALGAYLGMVAWRTRYIDYRGLSNDPRSPETALLLDQVYVEPMFVPERAERERTAREADLIRLLRQTTIEADEIERHRRDLAAVTHERWQALVSDASQSLQAAEVFARLRRVVVLGGPGTGKSTLTRWLARACVLGPKRRREVFGTDERIVPVVVRLAAFSAARQSKPHLTLREHILTLTFQEGGEPLRRAVGHEIDTGMALILLDGIDEEPNEVRRFSMLDAVDHFLDTTRTRAVITSRPAGYVRLRTDVPHVILPNLNAAQAETFVRRWHDSYERRTRPDAPDLTVAARRAEALLADVNRDERVRELASNPLMLVIITFIHVQNIRLPDRRVALYERAVTLLLGMWNQLRSSADIDVGGVELNETALKKVLGVVAMWSHGDPSGLMPIGSLRTTLARAILQFDEDADDIHATVESYLAAASERAGLLEERAPGVFAFWHQTFEEFLAATDLASDLMVTADRLLEIADDPAWREVVLLTVGYVGVILSQDKAAEHLIRSIRCHRLPDREVVLHTRLALAGRCIAEDVRIPKAEIEATIIEFVHATTAHPSVHLCTQFAETLKAIARQRMVPSERLVAELDAASEYFDWQIRSEIARLFGNAAQRGRSYVEGPCRRLLLDEDGDVRWQAARALASAGCVDDAIVEALVQEPLFTEATDAELRPLLESASLISSLRAIVVANDPSRRRRAASFLVRLGYFDDAVEHFYRSLLASPYSEVATTALIAHNREDVVRELLQRNLEDEDPQLVATSADLLIRLGDTGAHIVQALRDCLHSADLTVVVSAAQTMTSSFGRDDDVMDALGRVVQRGDAYWLEVGVRLLAELNHADSVVGTLLTRLGDEQDPYTVVTIVQALDTAGMTMDSESLAALEGVLRSNDWISVTMAAAQLIKLNQVTPCVIASLRTVLHGNNDFAVHFAARDLVLLGHEDDVAAAAVERLMDPVESDVAFTMLNALPPVRALEILLNALGGAVPGNWSKLSAQEWASLAEALRLQGDSADEMREVALSLLADISGVPTP